MTTAQSGGSELDFFVRLQPGEFIFREGDPGSIMFIIEDGNVELLKGSGGQEHQLAVLEQGDFFGEMAILEDQPRSASARAVTECQLLKIDKSTFNEMLRQNPEIAVRMLRKLSRRLRNTAGADHPHDAPPPRTDPGLMAVAQAAVRAAATPDTAPVGAVGPSAAQPAAPAAAAAGGTSSNFKLIDAASSSEIALPQRAEITVGRPDPVTGLAPDVDLSTLDTMRSVSRRHAKLFRQENDFFVCEEVGTANGTFVNQDRIKTGDRVPLKDGDQVSFGRVVMTFRQL
jgi:hypothetical protein